MSMYQYQPPNYQPPTQFPEPQRGMSSGQRITLISLGLALALVLGFVGGVAATRLLGGNQCAAANGGVITAAVPPGIATNTPIAPGANPTPSASRTPIPNQRPSTNPPPLTDGNTPKSGDVSLDQQMTTFWTAWQLVEQEYYGRPIDRQKMVYGATKGMMDALGDPHTAFNTPDETTQVDDTLKGQFGGVGIYIDATNDKQMVVQNPIPDTPASRAGIMAGDVIIKVDGKDITKMPQNQVIPMIKGPVGTKVTLTIVRGTQPPFDVTLTREQIVVPSATGKMMDNNILYIQVTIFGNSTITDLDKVLADNLSKQPKGIILDLRNNGGGYVNTAQELLGRFLPSDKVMMYQKFSTDAPVGQNALKVIKGQYSDEKTPMVVLVNGGTASASEITGGALQDYKRATLIGEKTYGKGSEQNVRPLSDGSSVRITVAHWLTPINREIDGIGLTPDINVTMSADDIKAKKDPQLDRATQFIMTGK